MRKFLFGLVITILLSTIPFNAQAVDEPIELKRSNAFSIPDEAKTTIINTDDHRLYKVYLGINKTEKLTLRSSKTFDVKITNPNNEIILQSKGIGRSTINEEGSAQIEFPTDTEGDYLIYIEPSDDNKNKFPYELNVTVGKPVLYSPIMEKRLTLNQASITSFNRTSSLQYFDLSNDSSIPNHSYITEVRTDGPDSGRNSLSLYTLKRSIRPNSSMTWIDTTYPNFKVYPSGYPNGSWIPVKQKYAFQVSALTFYQPGTYTFYPNIYISYKVELK
ncbi:MULTISPECIES: hypothetical protein [Bacillus]|uniref:hypothetical protein n=1 Tax=Bacillus TaxID=1386 RepID=UPI001E4B2E06|nr:MULTISPECIES: hypothetical protein [Bacillus]MCC9088192.1 hypothetical protein [Bacillus pumilus]MED1747221.1 hypothetical protein [Bacillus zhangzhouensis]